jgi:unsaturated rhamnogalacturonyl hydrolase
MFVLQNIQRKICMVSMRCMICVFCVQQKPFCAITRKSINGRDKIMISSKKLITIVAIPILLLLFIQANMAAQAPPASSSVNPDRIASNYPIRYSPATIESIKSVLDRVRTYLEGCTPASIINSQTKEPIADFSKMPSDAAFERGAIPIVSYEWGVTYSGMLLAAEATGDARFADYTAKRLKFLSDLFANQTQVKAAPDVLKGVRSIINPMSLDDSGSMCAAMIKANRAGAAKNVQPMIDNYIGYISTKQLRLSDGTLARNGPFPNTLWLDDLYMSVPALAQMGKATGKTEYYDDAVKQVLQFADRMFVKEKGLYMHGWVERMDEHPAFHWARANGWALMAKTELLEVLPENHPGRKRVLDLYRAHVRSLADCQSGQGLWHQLLNRNDSYLETSSSAIFTYCIARGINRGWISKDVYLQMVQLAWNAVAAKVNAQGQVEGTCIGTGMVFDPMFYYYRPTSVLAAHGYGTVLQAGAEMINMLKKK